MKLKERKLIIILPILLFLAWLYWGIIMFRNSISTPEELAEPEMEHPKQFFDYLFEAPLYILIGIIICLLWRVVQANMTKTTNH